MGNCSAYFMEMREMESFEQIFPSRIVTLDNLIAKEMQVGSGISFRMRFKESLADYFTSCIVKYLGPRPTNDDYDQMEWDNRHEFLIGFVRFVLGHDKP